jgi:glycosyltransferase involved in cell wall biosynthesis
MKICLVTTFPPSTGGLSEYGFHIAQELKRNPLLSLTVLADEITSDHVEPEGFSVHRCWSFNDPASSLHIVRALHKIKPDVVWFNLLFSTFGRNPLIAFGGLMTPLLARLSGRYTHVTLHHLMDTVDLEDVGVRHEWLYRAAGAVATRMLLLANSVSVLMPGYRHILNDKYGGDNVHVRAHGILARRPEFPDFSRRGQPDHRILAFGKWGTYKRLELMIEAFNLVTAQMPTARLVIGGGDHPQAAGYMESVMQQCAGNPQIEFRGYVPEDELSDLFQSSSVAVMPYSSSTGCSGVAHLACAHGVPIVCADLADFREMAQAEDLAIEFYPPGKAQGLADCLTALLQSSEKQQRMAAQNFSAALCMTMPNVVQKYLRQFEVQKRTRALKYLSRSRRLPGWMPSKSLLLRFMNRNSLSWARRSAILNTPWNGRDDLRLLHGNGNGSGNLNGARTAVDRHRVVGSSLAGNSRGAGGSSAAGAGADDHRAKEARGEDWPDPFALHVPNQREAEGAQPNPPNSKSSVDFSSAVHGNGTVGNGKNGVDGAAAWGDVGGIERTSQGAGQAGAGQRDRAVEGTVLGRSSDGDVPRAS